MPLSSEKSRMAVWVIVGTMAAVLAGAIVYSSTRKESPNVILIVSETTRADHLGCYGYERDTSDNLDGLAKSSVLFTNAVTQAPCTSPAVWNMLTSKYKSEVPAHNEYITIAEYFRYKGYATGAFVAHAFLDPQGLNLHQGFDAYDSQCERDHHNLCARKGWSITNAAIEWMEKHKDGPFFLFLFYFDPHDPYRPVDKFKGHYTRTDKFDPDRRKATIHVHRPGNRNLTPDYKEFLINAYDEEIRYVDYEVGRLLSYLEDNDELDNSILVFTADHGEELGDNDYRWDHCQLLSQEELWIPLVVKMPGQREQKIVEQPVQVIDIFPTLVDYFERPALPLFYGTLEGASMLPLINAEPSTETRSAAAFWKAQRCLYSGSAKYWLRVGKEYLTDVRSGEAIDDPQLMETMRGRLDKLHEKYFLNRDYDEETIERLRQLGYISDDDEMD
ncbi:MAG: sulfatase [Pseudomonadota bacterium]